MNDPTQVKALSEEFPHCKRFGLTFNYRSDIGPFFTAEQVERLLRAIFLFDAIPVFGEPNDGDHKY